MPEKSALRSSLDDLKDLPEPSAPQPKEPIGASGAGSLLADLLNETSNEAQRELDQIKAELQSRKNAEEEARRQAERARREELDRLREAEQRRREAALRPDTPETSGGGAAAASTAPAPVAEPAAVEPPKKNNTLIIAVAAVLIAAIGVGGWIMTTKEKAKAGAETASADDAAAAAGASNANPKASEAAAEAGAADPKTVESDPKAAAADPKAAEAAPKAAAADPKAAEAKPEEPPVPVHEDRVVALESESYERRLPEFAVPEYIKPKRKVRRGGKRGPGKGKIKIKGLNLGTGR